ncbi:MAG: CRISPR-associated helicase Cas3' [Chloroflexi bacterium]|nr:CRISPR-associated helicase Cas3' [Chloroflexota bacterium]
MPLYPYQERVKELLLSGKSVILQAPTGAGKTRAAIDPFIAAFFDHKADFFPRKCIYSVPMRVLANQFTAEYQELSSKYQRKFNREIAARIQTGDRPEDPKFEGNLIFSTIDQTLSSFLSIPYGVGKRSANLNAGAVLSSYLVFDELHLFDPDTTLPTTLEMLRMLTGITPFVVMTATFSSKMLSRLAKLLDAVVVPENEEQRADMMRIGSQVGKDRRFYAVDRNLTALEVLATEHEAKRTICICNTVQRAQDLYEGIVQELEKRKDQQTQVCLLHSRFYKDDRDEKEDWIREQFGIPQNEYNKSRLIVIATQVIEVGVDATCDVMHTALAPAASILQRAGRCARRQDEEGKVFVYLPRDEEGDPDYTPYFLKSKRRKTEHGRRLCEATWHAFNSSEFTDTHMSFEKEQALIDQVHTPIDDAILDAIQYSQHQHRDDMLKTMRACDTGMASELIRNIDSRFVVIHPNPETDEKLMRNPWYYDGFSFSPGTLAKAFAELDDLIDDEETPWVMRAAERAETTKGQFDKEGPSRQAAEYTWRRIIQEKGEVYTCPILAIHPSSAHYSKELGIVLRLSNTEHELKHRSRKKKFEIYTYERETYSEHVAGLYHAYSRKLKHPQSKYILLPLKDEIAFAMRQIENRFDLPEGAIDQMLRALFACHDLGKLDVAWQQWAHEWQRRVGQPILDNYMAAHTDYDGSEAQKKEQRKLKPPRPRHAGESAVAGLNVLGMACNHDTSLGKAGFTAIARHHTPSVDDYTPYQCYPTAVNDVREAMKIVNLPLAWADHIEWENAGQQAFKDGLISFMSDKERTLYFLFVRILRMSDQRSQM